jgi:hypothetical protein
MVPLGSSGVVLVFAVSAALAAVPTFYRVFRSSVCSWLSVLILFGFYFPLLMTNGVRFAISVGIIMLIIPSLWRRQLVLWSLGILSAAAFHYASILLWPLYWLLYADWPRPVAIFGIIGAIAISTTQYVSALFLKFMGILAPDAYDHYPDVIREKFTGFDFGFGYLVYLGIALIVLIFWERARSETRIVVVLRNTAFLSVLCLVALYQYWALGRIAMFFIPSLALFIPWVCAKCGEREERLLWTACFATLFAAMCIDSLRRGAHDAVPYQWVL